MDPETNSSKAEAAPQKKNHHLRNMEHLKALKEKNSDKLALQQQEQEKMEQTRQRLAALVLKRAEQARKQAEELKQAREKTPEPVIEEPKELDPEQIKQRQLKAFYRSRYHTFLAKIQENNKIKEELKLKESAKQMKKEDKLKQKLPSFSLQENLQTQRYFENHLDEQ